jgi:hypothetical protein
MTKTIAKIALLACLAAPAIAGATNSPSTSTDSDSYSFSLSTLSTVSIDYSWSDALLSTSQWTFTGGRHGAWELTTTSKAYDALSLSWTLSELTGNKRYSVVASGSFSDATNVNSASDTLSLGNLDAGSYVLSFTGTWNKVAPGWGQAGTLTPGSVNLLDGDGHGCSAEVNSFKAVAVSAVPEPETYAMLLSGLGLMGFIARRRSKQTA